jgi:N-acetylglucosamine-6-phosphate deacetylase
MKKRICLINAQIVTPSDVINRGYIVVSGTKIINIGHMQDFEGLKDDSTIDAKGRLVLAGFIDQHVHGGGNADTMDASREAFKKIAVAHTAYGTTSLCLTTIAASKDELLKVCENLRDYLEGTTTKKHARIIGIHLEGPFMNPIMKGAHQEKYMVQFNYSEFMDYKRVLGDYLRIVTVAPETSDSFNDIKRASQNSTVISLGHSNAEMEIASTAFDNGVKCITHFFNAMTPFHHRAPGVIGAALQNSAVMVEIIPDPNLVHPASMAMLYKLLGPERIIIITDSLRAAASKTLKKFTFAERTIVVNRGSCFLEDGTIWGSKLTMNEAVRNFMHFSNCSLVEVSRMASQNSAKLLGMSNKGSVEPGKDADLVILDEKFKTLFAMVEGNIVFSILHNSGI